MKIKGKIQQKTEKHLKKYVDTKDPIKVLGYLREQEPVNVSLIGEGSLYYDDVYVTVKVGDVFITYWWYETRGGKTVEDLDLNFDLNGIRISRQVEKKVIVYNWI